MRVVLSVVLVILSLLFSWGVETRGGAGELLSAARVDMSEVRDGRVVLEGEPEPLYAISCPAGDTSWCLYLRRVEFEYQEGAWKDINISDDVTPFSVGEYFVEPKGEAELLNVEYYQEHYHGREQAEADRSAPEEGDRRIEYAYMPFADSVVVLGTASAEGNVMPVEEGLFAIGNGSFSEVRSELRAGGRKVRYGGHAIALIIFLVAGVLLGLEYAAQLKGRLPLRSELSGALLGLVAWIIAFGLMMLSTSLLVGIAVGILSVAGLWWLMERSQVFKKR